MPAMLDDPMSPTIYRTSGAPPYPDSSNPQPPLPTEIMPRQVTLRDRVTIATILPFSSRHQVPPSLLAYLADQLNKEIEGGDTYPMIDTLSYDKFSSYWFQNFGAVMLLGNIEHAEDVEGDWARVCLGSFYIKPNYPGRSSHVCNAGFLVTDAARNRGVGRLMGETYIDWAPKLGYTYSVFNLVYETNVASCRIWDALGFKRIGRVKGCGNLKSYPDQLIDALIYGRDLGPEGEDLVSEERFDKIKFYLKFGKYPNGADRAEKSRLRSAATHYKLLEGDKLMLKDKEVISDPKQQYEIARKVHVAQHGGINKTTATIAESHHWIRIKETVSLVIKNCDVCKEMGKVPVVRNDGVTTKRVLGNTHGHGTVSAAGRLTSLPSLPEPDSHAQTDQYHDPFSQDSSSHLGHTSASPHPLNQSLQSPHSEQDHHLGHHHHPHAQHRHIAPTAQMHHRSHHTHHAPPPTDDYIALDPQIMEDVRNHLSSYIDHDHDDHDASSPHHPSDHDHPPYNNPFMLGPPTHSDLSPHHRMAQHHPSTTEVEDRPGDDPNHHNVDEDADLDMLIQDDDGDEGDEDLHEGQGTRTGRVDELDDALVDPGGEMDDLDSDDYGSEECEEQKRRAVRAQMAARAAEAAMRRDVHGEGKSRSGGEVGMYSDEEEEYRDG